MENMSKHIKVGEIEIPINYWSMSQEDRLELSLTLMEDMLIILHQTINSNVDKLELLDLLLISSIQTNEEKEEYEICDVMSSIRKILND